MNQLIGLTLDLQIILVAGYLAYKTSIVGKTNTDRTEDFLFKVLAYGLIARGITYGLKRLVQLWPWSSSVPDELVVLINGASVIGVATIAAIVWRKWGSKGFSWLMRQLEVYRDDHHATTWDTILDAKANWNFAQVLLPDGRLLESRFNRYPDSLPLSGITLNSDGIAMYVSSVWRPDDTHEEFDVEDADGFFQITYIPHDQIHRIEVSWKPKD